MSRVQSFLSKSFYSMVMLLLFFTCTSKEESSEEVSDSESEVAVQERMMVETGVQKLGSWVQFWKSIEPGFNPAAFNFERNEIFEELEWPEENYIVSESPFFPYLLANPEGGGFVDIYSYKVFVPTEGKPGFQPDSEVIYFKSNGMRERLLFIGPSGGFEDAVWVSPTHLLVAGFFEEEDGITPKLWLIDTVNKKYSIFKNPLHSTIYQKEGYLKQKLRNLEF
ncbi:bifunctional isocitrate dehydrogenase kinase/phosphatase [Shivajiella indica]|uniref:Bifunctional isocitrate dehydrogenase kinase/phosphatase n=1 Tax=Shivajiella indica TaxID=872115 RepID=A0ABW5B3W2_9BACT